MKYDELLADNGRLLVELANARAENARLRRSRANASLRKDRRMIEGAAQDARFLASLHAAGLNTSRRADTHGFTRWRHESAVSLLRLGGVFGRRGWLTTDPTRISEGIKAGREKAIGMTHSSD